MKCVICGKIIKNEVTLSRVVGWVEKRKDGGANHIKRRRETGEYAHKYCVEYGLNQTLI